VACCGIGLTAIFSYDVTRGLRATAASLPGWPIRLCSVLVLSLVAALSLWLLTSQVDNTS